jgi:DNA-binding NtrC family response regulator/tetratricopeptide (TPR) repeat protein
MTTPLLAHRFRIAEVLDEDASILLARATDVASKREGWLLRLSGEGKNHTRAAVLLRLKLFESRLLGRDHEVEVQLSHEQDSYFFLKAPADARPSSESADPSSLCEELERGLSEWARAGVAAGALTAARVWVDADGAFFLPSAYCRPQLGAGAEAFGWFAPEQCRRELESLCVELKHREPRLEVNCDRSSPESNAGLTPGFSATLERAPEAGIWMQVEGEVETPRFADALAAWSADHGRPFFELRPFVGPRIAPRRAGNESPVLLLSGSNEYVSFAESLIRLDQGGWLDGSETLILLRAEDDRAGLGEALRLYCMSAKEFEAWKVGDVVLFEAHPRSENQAGLSAIAAQVLEALEVARRPLSETVLAAAFAIESVELVDALLELSAARRVGLGFALAEELARAPALVAHARSSERAMDRARTDEVEQLLAAALLTVSPRRNQWGNAWLRAMASALTATEEVGPLLRDLAERSEKEGVGLLEYTTYERLMAWSEITQPRLEDQGRAAIRQAQEHRRRGEVDRTDQILRTALEDIQSHVEVPPERIAPLICDLVLERAHFSLYRSRFQEAEEQLRATLERYRDHLPAVQRTRIYLDLSWALVQMGRTRESMDPCNLALRLVDTLRHPQLVARAYNQLGYAHYKESDYETSIRCFQRALVLRQQVGDDLAVARTYNNLSLSQRGLGQMHEAERSLRESLRLKRGAGDHRGASASLLNLGFVHLDQRQFDEARRCGVECLQLAEELHHPETEAEAYGLLGEIAAGKGKLEDALRYLRRDLDICESTGHEAERLATLRRLVDVLLQAGEVEEAAERLELARELLIRQPSRFEAAMLDRLEGGLFLRSEAFDPAGDAFGSAARVFASLRRYGDQVECLVRRAETEFALERLEAARQTLRELRDVALSQELATVPDAVRELEAKLGPTLSEDAETSPEDLLRRAAQLLRESGHDEEPETRRWLSAVASVLEAQQVLWLVQDSGDTPRLESSAVAMRGVAAPLRDLDPDQVGDGGVVLRDGGWSALIVPQGRWLCVQRVRELDRFELDFLSIVAWSLAPRSYPATHPARVEAHRPRSVPADGKATSEVIIGRSAAIQELLATVDTVSAAEVTVLLLGENGTGKDLVARAIHRKSVRAEQPFVALNCASIPPSLLESELFGHEKGAFTSAHERRPGVFERAGRGTIFLDEIGEMSLSMQAKMLRVLQDRRFTRVGGTEVLHADVRVIAATNRKLLEEVREGRFRMDLYYRLNVVSIEIPPLRERGEDIEMLAEHFVRSFAAALGSPARRISREALSRLRDYAWPGNVRELENVVKNALVFTRDPVIRSENLPEALSAGDGLDSGQSVEQAVQSMIASEDWSEDRPLLPRVELLLAHEAVEHLGNKTLAAKVLGITKPTLYTRLRRFEALYGGSDEAEGRS